MNNVDVLLGEMRMSIISMDLSYSQTIKLLNRILKIERALDNTAYDKPKGEIK